MSEKSFPQAASPTLWEILPSFGCRSGFKPPSFGQNLPPPGTRSLRKAIFRHALYGSLTFFILKGVFFMLSANDLKQLYSVSITKAIPPINPPAVLTSFRATPSPSTMSRAIRSLLRRGSASISMEKPPHFQHRSTAHIRSASPFRITCCASLRARSHRTRSARRAPAKAVCLASAAAARKFSSALPAF